MSGSGKCFLGIILIIVFFLTLTIESIPIIWTGAGLVGAYFIYAGIREMISGKRYQCKTCGFRGSQKEVLAHAVQEHPDQFSDAERQKLAVYLGLPAITPTRKVESVSVPTNEQEPAPENVDATEEEIIQENVDDSQPTEIP